LILLQNPNYQTKNTLLFQICILLNCDKCVFRCFDSGKININRWKYTSLELFHGFDLFWTN